MEDGAAVKNGTWDAIHVVEVKEDGPSRASYKLTTTIMLYMSVEKIEIGETNMAGSLTRQVNNKSKRKMPTTIKYDVMITTCAEHVQQYNFSVGK